ncbi:MAG: virulence RhuM family protein [Phycisphaeraceae bacterium]|nr:virulence RhuM family protein [Phycisphaeraceae bacterium]
MSRKPQHPEGGGAPGFLLYQAPDGTSRLSVRLDGQTVWLTQAQMAELFQTTKQNISLHVRHVLDERELPADSVVKEYLTTAADGKSYATRHYALDMIIAVGYRVRSARGTQFRQWATATLAEYLTKGFAIDDARLKEGRNWGADYFDELLARIRDIRASERRFYQKITDIYATSIDYDPAAPLTQEFYATVQNKLHWAITGRTAAETIFSRADADKPNMGLTTWKNAPRGPIRRADVGVAKNYLIASEIAALNRIVAMYLDYAEDQAARQVPMHMADWVKKLDGFLSFNERNILTHAGNVSAAMAEEHAARQFEKFDHDRLSRLQREPSSDFDRLVERSRKLKPGRSSRPPKKPDARDS